MLYYDSMSQTAESAANDQEEDLEDWSKKYDVTLTALSQEYYEYINLVRQVDEKANKYLIVLSIFIAGFFSIIASPLTDKLSFNATPFTGIGFFALVFCWLCGGLISFLSWCFVVCVVACVIYGCIVIKGFLKSLEYIQTVRLPNLEQVLHDTGDKNYVEYKQKLIQCYQDAITELNRARASKRN